MRSEQMTAWNTLGFAVREMEACQRRIELRHTLEHVSPEIEDRISEWCLETTGVRPDREFVSDLVLDMIDADLTQHRLDRISDQIEGAFPNVEEGDRGQIVQEILDVISDEENQ